MEYECDFCKIKKTVIHVPGLIEFEKGFQRTITADHFWCLNCLHEEFDSRIFGFKTKEEATKYFERKLRMERFELEMAK